MASADGRELQSTRNINGHVGNTPVVVTVGSLQNNGDNKSHIQNLTITGVTGGEVENAYVAGRVEGDIRVELTTADSVNVSDSDLTIEPKQLVYTEDHKAKRLQDYFRDVIKKEEDVYVPTSSYNTAVQCLKKYSHVTVVGGPGSGKTTLAYRILRDFNEDQDNKHDVFIVTDPEKMKHWRNPKNPTIFLIDDMLGKTSFSRDTLKKWKAALEELEPVLGQKKGKNRPAGLKLIITFRDSVFKEALPHFGFLSYSVFQDDAIVDIVLTCEEKKTILEKQNMINNGPLTEEDVKIISSMDFPYGFPYTCSLFFKLKMFHQDPQEFFSNPIPFLQDTLRDMVIDCPEQYAALLLVLLNNGEVNIADLSSTSSHLEEIGKVREINIQAFVEKRYPIFSELCGSFLSRDSDTVAFSHEAVKHALVYVEGKQKTPLVTGDPSL